MSSVSGPDGFVKAKEASVTRLMSQLLAPHVFIQSCDPLSCCHGEGDEALSHPG